MEKKVMANLEKCYSIAPLTYQGKQHILVAAEKYERCILFDAEGNEEATVWEPGVGGVMTMVQVPGTDGQFLATHKFYSPNDSKEARIVVATPVADMKWEVKTLCDLPFVHRFDIVKGGENYYLIACALKSGHEYKNDWSMPGKIFVGKLPKDLSAYNEDNQLELTVLKDGVLKNHGYSRVTEDGVESSLVCADNGIFRIWPPQKDGEDWKIETLLETPASDALLIDLDGDGRKELVMIAEFHGEIARIYKEGENGYEMVYEYPEKAEMLHAIWAAELGGVPTAILGYRKGARRLMLFTYDKAKGAYAFKTIDDDCGPANAYAYNYGGKDRIIAANRETDEIAMYIL